MQRTLWSMGEYAVEAFLLNKQAGDLANTECSALVAYTTGKHAKRSGIGWAEVVEWHKSSYGAIWVKYSNLNPGLDKAEVLAYIKAGFDSEPYRKPA